jgi:transcriptional regulator with XRE-family HTH domain
VTIKAAANDLSAAVNDLPAGFDLGRRLKEMRQNARWTLEHLADRSGVSISALSKIENGQVSPAFDTIMKVAHAYGFSFAELLTGGTNLPPAQTAPRGFRTITRQGQALPFTTALYQYDVHSADLTRKGMIPLVMQVKSRAVPPVDEWSNHKGEEFIYVTRGAVELHTEFYAPVRLEAGESAYIDSTMRHAFVSVGKGDAEVLSICMTESLTFGGTIVGTQP